MLKIFLSLVLFLGSYGCSSLLYYPKQGVFYDPKKLQIEPSDVFFNSENGDALLHGWHFRTPKKKRKGLIVYFHGNGENLTSHYVTLLFVLDHGYDFFIFDYQGYGQSEGAPSPEGTVLDGIAALKKGRELAGSEPLIVFAQSLGGAVAMKSVHSVKNEVPIQLMIVDSTFHSYQEVAQDALSKSWLTWPFQWLAYLVMSDRHAPKSIISEISPVPLVVIHGTDDPIIAYRFGEKVFQLAEEPKELWTIDGGRHIDALWRQNGELRVRFREQLDQAIAR